MPAEATFQDPMAPVNDDKIIEAAMKQVAVDAEITDILGFYPINESVDIPGVGHVNDKNQCSHWANAEHWQSIRFADEQAHLYAQVFL